MSTSEAQIAEFNHDTTVVIRSVQERTIDACEESLPRAGLRNIARIENLVPFGKCLTESIEHGIEENRTWTLCIDADVLITRRGMVDLAGLARGANGHTFTIRVNALDTFHGTARKARNHLYRTRYLEKALRSVPGVLDAIRPEHGMTDLMHQAGCSTTYDDAIALRVHDFEQFYSDIYRKCFVYAHKHRHRASKLLPYWKTQSLDDGDYKVALLGFSDGLQHFGKVTINKHQRHQLTDLT